MGPTGAGKTGVAEALADHLDAQLINADASQVYRGMDIGTAKPVDKSRYQLLDLCDPDESFGVGEFVQLAQPILTQLFEEGRNAIVVGGTGLYIRALFEEYQGLAGAPNPALRELLNVREESEGLEALAEELRAMAPDVFETVDPKNPHRVKRALEKVLLPTPLISVKLPPFQKLKIALSPNPETLDPILEKRSEVMVQNGWVQEVETLRKGGFKRSDPGLRAIGYGQLWDFLDGKIELEEALATTIVETRRYAKRQRTWLRSEPNVKVLKSAGEEGLFEASELIRPFVR